MQELFRLMERVAPPDDGAGHRRDRDGKELVARAIHGLSDRARRPFVAVNSSAIPETLIDSELFGHTRGSFTGAVETHRGLIEEAQGGTLFIDEVSTLSLQMQVKLLRVFEDHAIRKVGSSQSQPIDFRLIVATNEDLGAKVARSEFREDLFYRLSVFPLEVPPLRDRREDIRRSPSISAAFSHTSTGSCHRPSEHMIERLKEMPWPGNVRELEHFYSGRSCCAWVVTTFVVSPRSRAPRRHPRRRCSAVPRRRNGASTGSRQSTCRRCCSERVATAAGQPRFSASTGGPSIASSLRDIQRAAARRQRTQQT
jgi:transcriptional regulator with GAF, ATPase, and Fis domain